MKKIKAKLARSYNISFNKLVGTRWQRNGLENVCCIYESYLSIPPLVGGASGFGVANLWSLEFQIHIERNFPNFSFHVPRKLLLLALNGRGEGD